MKKLIDLDTAIDAVVKESQVDHPHSLNSTGYLSVRGCRKTVKIVWYLSGVQIIF